ncbi:hypothetical protein ASG60_08365 [Methylobacterium sp. Leaf469]|uniref:hypothetical protein n=1 Tax=Methylobacterium sp. Leaf469 TaxID=1736387 RepID=UPI0006F6515E|nr:hypothetical protein [Methylobacterium sp. Leaf469]KQT93369.1 hypothetical protein ASG60_08365 [Methylobacterium sp. Leaf469]
MRTMTRSLSESARANRHRHLAKTRKQSERERRRAAGQPDLNTIDRAIVEAVRSHILRDREVPPMQRLIRVEALVTTIGLHLRQRVHAAHDAGAEPVRYTTEGVAAAIQCRLFQPPARPGKPAPKPVDGA